MSDFTVPGWPEDEEEEFADTSGLGEGPADLCGETFRRIAENMMAEGYTITHVLTGLTQVAAEFQWELNEQMQFIEEPPETEEGENE
jgi:hypothetical protein